MDIMLYNSGTSVNEDENMYKTWFQFADSDEDGRLTGPDAVPFFRRSGLTQTDLKQVWAVSDASRQGFLGFWEFVAAMRIISLAQTGVTISSDMLKDRELRDISPPTMVGLDDALEAAAKTGRLGNSSEVIPRMDSQVITPLPMVKEAGWFKSKSENKLIPLSAVTSVVDGLKRLYVEKLRPLELAYKYNDFVSPTLVDSDFDAKPMVMLLGQYSTGKTTFIRHLLRRAYPGSHIGPEPTTDRFVVVMDGPDERSIPGNTVAVQADMPFGSLQRFGTAFLSKFECAQMPHPLLEHISFVDTPGVLSGEKQRTQRSYDFTGVIEWFASKCDLILLLFDPHKLDISDEFNRVISSLHGNSDKIRVVLNKADQVDTQQLMRVYGALTWSLGKVLNTPEVMRVYIGSFNVDPVKEETGSFARALFQMEQNDLLVDLKDIPRKSCDRKINEFVKRARAAKINAMIVSHLRAQMPTMMGRARAQQKLIDNLGDEFAKIQREHHLPAGDFPKVEDFKEILSAYDFSKFERLKPNLLQTVDQMLGYDIPELLKKFRNPYG